MRTTASGTKVQVSKILALKDSRRFQKLLLLYSHFHGSSIAQNAAHASRKNQAFPVFNDEEDHQFNT